MRKPHILLTCYWLMAAVQVAHAGPPPSTALVPASDCSATHPLVVLSGNKLAPLLETPVRQLSLLKVSPTGFTPIAFQIDRKDSQGRYIIEEADRADLGSATLGPDDELVFVAADAGIRLSDPAKLAGSTPLVEIRIAGTPGAPPKWIYAGASSERKARRANHYIEYDQASDLVTSATYSLGFSGRKPFLVDSFRWKIPAGGGWSPDLTDTMKIRHRGRFLGLLPFRRTQRDYSSRLTAVKIGPLRVIRRTENRIRVLWHLKTPALYIDYVMMPNGFIMDTVIELPFNVGLFFSDLETLTTVDWSEDNTLPRLTIHSPEHHKALTIDGHMSSDKHHFNLLQSSQFAMTSSLGDMLVSLEIPPGVPITPWLYLRDAQDEADPPENRIGQFGNAGFRTTGWEQIDTEVQHVKFTVCLDNN